MHFIQQQIAAVGLFDQPAFVFRRPGKGALAVAKEMR